MATLHGCRWEWCRNVFDTHNALVDHIKAEHLLSMRPVTKRNAAAMLRAEGYTPEEVASRLIPGYEPTQPPAPVNDPPHQAPQSSPLVQQQPQLAPVPDTTPQEQPGIEQPAAVSSIQSPPATPPSTKNLERTTDDDGDILMPSSSPPPDSPKPSPSPERPAAKDMLVDDLEHDGLDPPIEYLVPVSSPPPAASARGSSVGPRTPRLKRRSSFSQMSSSPPADEFTAPRYEPLPASPSTAKMIEEREKELKTKGTEREADKRLLREEGNDNVSTMTGPDRETPPAAEELCSLIPEATPRATTPRPRPRPKQRFIRGRGHSGLHFSTPGRQVPPITTSRRMSPGLRIESRSNPGELQPPETPPREHSARPQTSPKHVTQSTTDETPTTEQMISQYTHADSYDDEDILDDLKADLDDPDLGLQTQVPYISQTQTQTSGLSQTQA